VIFKTIGYSKVLIIVQGSNTDSFATLVASLSGYIQKEGMQVKLMTIIASQTFSKQVVHEPNSFFSKLILQSNNFKKHKTAMVDLDSIATEGRIKATLLENELIPHLGI